jgi:hypothetical protein
LSRTFWFGWALPVVGGNLLVSATDWWLIKNLGFVTYYVVIAAEIAYGIAAAVPVWRSAANYSKGKVAKFAARGIVTLFAVTQVASVGAVAYTLGSIKLGVDPTHDSDRLAEKKAIPSKSHPMAGFWKSSPNDNFGLAISPAEGRLYSVAFCGPGGCFKPGTYRPNTPLVGDDDYQVVSNDTLLVHGRDGWSTYKRAASRGDENFAQ